MDSVCQTPARACHRGGDSGVLWGGRHWSECNVHFLGGEMSLRRVEQIVYIKIPVQGPGKTQRHIAYVEFGDEEAMKAALAKKGEVSVHV